MLLGPLEDGMRAYEEAEAARKKVLLREAEVAQDALFLRANEEMQTVTDSKES